MNHPLLLPFLLIFAHFYPPVRMIAAADPLYQSVDIVQPRVIGGQGVQEGKYPFMASLQYQGRHKCGATILTEDTLLTAAHCVLRKQATAFRVLIGHTNNAAPVKQKFLFKVKSTKLVMDGHLVVVVGTGSDIAIVKLDRPIPFDQYDPSRVAQICLPRPSDKPDSSRCVALGWGQMTGGRHKPRPKQLQEAILPIIPHKECTDIWPLPDRVLCAGLSMSGGNRSICFGDSGGPLVCPLEDGGGNSSRQILQFGIVSFGTSFDCNKGPNFFTRVTSYLDWIRTETEQ